ncbi:hypothetical protein [Thermogemmatispora carboxidivorans]|uniref:hypothetical protein n=1 Tax=Thermogemmatispora carboxidivorans TaxID=1382306 RepID=UPI00069B889D|nr:hypothetical protein [Thermogemmatispora carboxidivorans]
MRLIEHNQQAVSRIVLQPLGGLGKDAALDGAHQHVFQHGIVSNQDVGAAALDLVTAVEFAIVSIDLDSSPDGVIVQAFQIAGRPAPPLFLLLTLLWGYIGVEIEQREQLGLVAFLAHLAWVGST